MLNNKDIKEFFLNWNSKLPFIYSNYLRDDTNKLIPARNLINTLSGIVEDFLSEKPNELENIVLIHGLRGTGKTTLLIQLINLEKYFPGISTEKIFDRVFLDVGKLINEGYTINDFLKFYEQYREISYENNTKKILFVFDEIHYDPNWSATLKHFFDSTKGNKNVILFATGSSSLKIKLNPDLARRSTLIELFPLTFREYLDIKYGIKTDSKISNESADRMINAKNAKELYNYIRSIKNKADEINENLPLNSINDYFLYGGFPFNLFNRNKAYENVQSVINNIILKDVLSYKEFRFNVSTQLNTLIYILANTDVMSTQNIKIALGIKDDRTVKDMLDSIEKSGLTTRIKSYGGAYSSSRKSSKYLFNSSSLRASILDGIIPTGLEGKKLEDSFALLYHYVFKKHRVRDINYDAAKGGADFILKNKDSTMIIVETGFNKETTEQILKTNIKVKAKYGILFGSRRIELENEFVVKIPLIFLLML